MASLNKKPEPLPKEVHAVIYGNLGAASTAWEGGTKGEFKVNHALQLGEEIEKAIQTHMVKRPKGFKENLIFFFKHAPAGLLIYFINYCWITLFIYLGINLFGIKITFWESLGIVVFIRGVKIAWEMAKDKHINDEEELGK